MGILKVLLAAQLQTTQFGDPRCWNKGFLEDYDTRCVQKIHRPYTEGDVVEKLQDINLYVAIVCITLCI